jgi:hypothetical protein
MTPALRPSRPLPALLALALVIVLTTLTSCSRISIAYEHADLAAKQYASDYLDLTSEQLKGWEPHLNAELDRHRADELPHLAAFFDQTLKTSQAGFDQQNTTCLTTEFGDLYRRHARVAVTLAAPLLSALTPDQIDALERKFRKEREDDRADLAKRQLAWEKQKRTKRYVKAIENWTGSLTEDQKAIVADVTGRMPDAEAALIAYRSQKRQTLIEQLRKHADQGQIDRYMTAWLVDFSDLPPELKRAGDMIGERMSELLIRLGASLDDRQRNRFSERLRQLRDDLMKLQKQPRKAPLQC